jgi:hypothetical protein
MDIEEKLGERLVLEVGVFCKKTGRTYTCIPLAKEKIPAA